MNKYEFLGAHPKVSTGGFVYARDGKQFGLLASMEDGYFIVEQGIFAPRDFTFTYDEVDEVRDGKVILKYLPEEAEKLARTESDLKFSQA